ncbi:MAG: cell division protein CrgA [Actinomycetota bacterium]
MAPPKRKTGGRTTPKGTRPQDGARVARPDHNENGVAASTRYTPPIPKYVKESPRWVPILMFTLFILGALVILLYYLGAVPGGRSNYYLLVGLAFILGGLFTATKYH